MQSNLSTTFKLFFLFQQSFKLFFLFQQLLYSLRFNRFPQESCHTQWKILLIKLQTIFFFLKEAFYS